ncbi:S-adenosyl-L-methionine-dependent methyltransferase [Apodospora peruviana]|uniref:S-adenosyl-L-methionine-dependent methyltransferase n=1 Tax=Apodospora peruviana TaxID=516989 RepID=A0AAE0HW67_9PEZI|nr:S-adenosyl-L-methionine-dependent methyltransferase [Apodospora peruviana]
MASSPSPPSPPCSTEVESTDTKMKTKVILTGTPETLLVALYARHLERQLPNPVLDDQTATAIIEQLNYDFPGLGVGRTTTTLAGIRGKVYDGWVLDFLARHPTGATVLNMACGLDTRAHRLKCGTGGGGSVRWIDVDLPDVVELRRKTIPDPTEGNYTLMAGSALDPAFVATLPNDWPTVIVMEGFCAYLPEADGKAMVADFCQHFKCGGEMMFDNIGRFMLAVQGTLGFLKKTSSSLKWAMDDPKDLEKVHEGLKLVDAIPTRGLDGIKNDGLWHRFLWWVSGLFPSTRKAIQYVRYVF